MERAREAVALAKVASVTSDCAAVVHARNLSD